MRFVARSIPANLKGECKLVRCGDKNDCISGPLTVAVLAVAVAVDASAGVIVDVNAGAGVLSRRYSTAAIAGCN